MGVDPGAQGAKPWKLANTLKMYLLTSAPASARAQKFQETSNMYMADLGSRMSQCLENGWNRNCEYVLQICAKPLKRQTDAFSAKLPLSAPNFQFQRQTFTFSAKL